MLAWVAELFRFFFTALPRRFRVQLPESNLDVVNGMVAAQDARTLLADLGLLAVWKKTARGVGVALPGVEDSGAPAVSFHFLLYAAIRWMDYGDRHTLTARRLLRYVAVLWDRSMQDVLLERPRKSQHDPLNEKLFQKAVKGEDKVVLLVNDVLGHRRGSNLELEAPLRSLCHWRSFQWARWAGTVTLVACAMAKARAEFARALALRRNDIVGVRVSYDDSRVSSMEVMVSHVYAAGVMATGPIQVKPDQSAMLLKKEAFTHVQGMVTGGGPGGAKRVNIKKRASTLANFLALANVLMALLPIEDLRAFTPSSWDKAGFETQRRTAPGWGRDFSWNPSTGEASWCLAEELSNFGGSSVWILVLVSDEGAQSVAMFFWLLGVAHCRCILWRDPSHRLSNVFVRALQGVPTLRAHICDALALHKFRRAPFGTGRLFRECKETVALLLQRWEECHSLIEPFVPSIAADHGVSPGMENVRAALEEFCRRPLGPRVELRRWFTFIDMAPALLRIWHSLLLALCAMAMFRGDDPWAQAAAALQQTSAARGGSDGEESAAARDFHYRQECLRILLDATPRHVVKSLLIIFGKTRAHQAWAAKALDEPRLSLRHLLSWAHPTRHITNVVLPSVQQALCNQGQLNSLGFETSTEWADSEEWTENGSQTLSEEQAVLRLHLLTTVQLVEQWWLFELIPQCAPWSFVRVLHPSLQERRECIAEMKQWRALFDELERSAHSVAKSLLETIFFRTWAVVREPLELFANDDWAVDSVVGRRYIEECVGDYTHTLLEENTFNELRNNEGRAAKHKQRGENYRMALSLSAIRTRCPKLPHVEVEDQDVSLYRNVQVRASTYHPETLKHGKSRLGVDTSTVVGNQTWPTTKFDIFAKKNVATARALFRTPRAQWGNIWMAKLMPRNAIVGSTEQECLFYTVSVVDSLALLWRLEELEIENELRLAMDKDSSARLPELRLR